VVEQRNAQSDVFHVFRLCVDNAGMPVCLPEPSPTPLKPWQANLAMQFARRDDGTILAASCHEGPLRIQKALYPEGRDICHAIVLHPPAGIAGGDELSIAVGVAAGAHALLTTPGAGKWYRSAGPWAAQALDFELADDAVLEWLPQETIVFDGARGRLASRVRLGSGARYLGWEVLCLGRRAAGETFDRGELLLQSRIEQRGKTLWLERGSLVGGDPLLGSAVGLAGNSVCATLLAAGSEVDAGLVSACREAVPGEAGARHGLTVLPGLLIARYLGHSSEAARAWFSQLWHLLRPALLGREAIPPRIWNT
jgi:urease accessory protein